MPNIPTNKPGLAVGRDEVGAALGNVEAQIQALQADTSASTAVTVTIPQPCTGAGIGGGGFVLAYEVIKKGLRATFCATVPGDTVRIKTVIIKHSDATASATSFKQNRLQQTIELDTDQTASGHVEYKFQPLLEYNSQYDLIKLVAIATDGTRLQDPPTDAKFGDLALATFTTPVMFGVPSDPGSAAPYVQFSGLDQDTGDHYASITLRMYAPLNVQTGAAQSWGAATVDLVHFVVALGSGKAKHYTVNLSGADLTQTDPGSPSVANRGYIDITLKNLQVGDLITWIKNICWAGGERAVSVGAPVTVQAGGVQVNPANLTLVGLNVITTDPYTSKSAGVDLLFTQPTLPVALKWVSLERKLHSDPVGNYAFVLDRFMLKKQEYHTVGQHTVRILEGLHFKPSAIYDLRITFYAVGGLTFQKEVLSIATGANPDVANDTGVPSSLATPTLAFIDKANLVIKNMVVGANFNAPADPAKYVVLYNGANLANPFDPANQFYDLITYLNTFKNAGGPTIQFTAGASVQLREIAGRLPIGQKNKDQLEVKLKHLRSLFGASANIYCYFWAANQAFGLSALPSQPSAALNLATALDFLDANGAVNLTNVGQSIISTQNLLYNGHFHYKRGTGNVCKGWGNQKASGSWIQPIGSGNGLEFDLANHRLHWTSTGIVAGWPTQKLGDPQNDSAVHGFNVDPGDFYTVGMVMWSSFNNHTRSMRLAFLNGTDTDFSAGQVSVAFAAALTPVPHLFQVKLQIPSNIVLNDSLWIQLQCLDGGLSQTNDLLIDLIGMNAGQQFTAYSPRASFETSSSGQEFWDQTPNYTASQGAQAVSPTGIPSGGATPGGGAAPGFGKLIDLTA